MAKENKNSLSAELFSGAWLVDVNKTMPSLNPYKFRRFRRADFILKKRNQRLQHAAAFSLGAK